MNARRLKDRYEFKIPDNENEEDTFFMVDILAAWIRIRQTLPATSATTLAGTLLCPIFRTEKGANYAKDADEYRSRFRGISERPERTGEFLSRVRGVVRDIRKPEDVFKRRFSEFFNDDFDGYRGR